MAVRQNGRTLKNGLIFHFDTSDIYNSYKGEPTTNMNGTGQPYIYSWWSRNTQTITVLNETYQGQPIYRVSLSLDIPDQVSYINSRWGAGSGWYLGGQTYNANTPYMVSTIWRPVSHPDIQIYGHPSNIGGWGLTVDGSVDYDGNWKLHRIDRNYSSTASDARYFHIHAPTAVLNQVVSVDITHMQQEAKSRRTYFTQGTRSATQGLLDLTGNHTMDISNVSFSSDSTSKITFDGTNDYINIPSSNLFDTSAVTVEVVVKPYASSQYGFWFEKGAVNTQYSLFMEGSNIVWRTASAPGGGSYDSMYFPSSLLTANQWHHVVGTYTPGTKRVYHNSYLKNDSSYSSALTTNQGNQFIGMYNSGGYPYNGEIAVVKVYNRALSAEEVHKNYLHYKERFSLPNVSPSIATNTLGNSATSAAPSARLLREMGYTTNGNYWLKPDGIATPFQAYIEFDSNGGDPWVHVGTIADEDEPSNNSSYHVWSNNMNSAQACPPWDDDTTFGGSTPTFVGDYKNAGWGSIPFKQIMIKDAGNSQRKLLYTNEGQIKSSNTTLRDWFGSLKWDALGSDSSSSAYSNNRVRALDITNYGVNDPVLQSSAKSKLLFKYGEKDGAQDGNKDRTMIAWHRHDAGNGVDGPSGLGCFTNRGGTIDYRDIVPGSVYADGQDFPPSSIGGTYYYSIWIR